MLEVGWYKLSNASKVPSNPGMSLVNSAFLSLLNSEHFTAFKYSKSSLTFGNSGISCFARY